jgi:thiol-disulfide isomerase/thioredoxin
MRFPYGVWSDADHPHRYRSRRDRAPRTWRIIAAALLAAALAVGAAGCTSDDKEREPALTGDLVAGGSYDPGTYKGKVTVVNFWGSWCPPCRAEMPGLVRAYEELSKDGVVFLGVNVRDPNIDLAKAFVEQYKVPFPSIRDPQSKLALEFDIPPAGIPTTVILGKDGRPAKTFRSAVLETDLLAAVREVLADG